MIAGVEQGIHTPNEEEDPTVFKSRAKGNDLHETMSHKDTFEEDIRKGYPKRPILSKGM